MSAKILSKGRHLCPGIFNRWVSCSNTHAQVLYQRLPLKFLDYDTTMSMRTVSSCPCENFLSTGLYSLNRRTILSSHGKHWNSYRNNLSIITPQRNGSSSKHQKKIYRMLKDYNQADLFYAMKQQIKSSNNAEFFISHLSSSERRLLFEALSSMNANTESNNENESEESGEVTGRQLRLVFVQNFFPFIGFGFLDNAIMILAGEYIDMTIGLTLGISTMAAAALGNTISDVAGIGLAGSVEMLFLKVGLPVPALTPEQAEQRSTIFWSYMGKVLGIVIGCVIGMFPLLFLEEKKEVVDEK